MEWLHSSIARVCLLARLFCLSGLEPLVNGEELAPVTTPLDFLTARYKHVQYDFTRLWAGRRWHGQGELWLWIPESEKVKVRFQGQTTNTKFGSVNITTVIDASKESLHVTFHMNDFDDAQCVTYPFATMGVRSPDEKFSKLKKRDELEVKELDRFSESQLHSGLFTFPWTHKKTLELSFSEQGSLQSVLMKHSNRPTKWFNVSGAIDVDANTAHVGETFFDAPDGCLIYNEIDNPLARLKMKMPHKSSSILSDLLALISLQGLRELINVGNRYAVVPVVTLNVLSLPGDIAVMLEEPPTPHLAGQGSGVKYTYEAKSYKTSVPTTSRGTVWFNKTERAFRVSGEAPHTVFGAAKVDFIARAEPLERGVELPSANYMKKLAQSPGLTKVYTNPVVFCQVSLSRPNEKECVAYVYPSKSEFSELPSMGVDIDRSIVSHLRFVEVAELEGEDCGIWSARLANGHLLFLWMDNEEVAHHAILRVDVRNRTSLLRTSKIVKWFDDPTGSPRDFSSDLLPPMSWQCGNTPFHKQFASLGLRNSSNSPNNAVELLDTLYATEKLPTHYALIELMALPGDLQIKIKQDDQSGAYTLSPANRIYSFLGATYKHFSYQFERRWKDRKWGGSGEVWVWFKKQAGKDDQVKIRFRGVGHTVDFGQVIITIIIDSEDQNMYVNVNRKDMGNEQQCVTYPFPSKHSGYMEASYSRLRKFMAQDLFFLETFEEKIKNMVGSRAGNVSSVELPWSARKSIEIFFDKKGNFRGLDTLHKNAWVKRMRVVGDVEFDDAPPVNMEHQLFDPKNGFCKQQIATVAHPLATVMLKAPHQRSSALRDFLFIITMDVHDNLEQLLSVLIFSLPGDIPVMIEKPDPPNFEEMGNIAFDYSAEVFNGGVSHTSTGTVWSSPDQQAFHLFGESPKTTEFGHVKVDFIAHAGEENEVTTRVQLWNGHVEQCLLYQYPDSPGSSREQLWQSAANTLSFEGVDAIRGEDCSIFRASMTHGRTIRIWVDMEEASHYERYHPGQTQDVRAIMRVVVTNNTHVLRITTISDWRENEDFGVQLNAQPAWRCSPEGTGDETHPIIAHFGIDRIRQKSKDLHDTLYAMQDMDPSFALLEVLSLPGDVAIALDTSPADLWQSVVPGKSMPPELEQSATATIAPVQPGVPLQPKRPSSFHSSSLSAVSLTLSLVAVLSLLVLLVVTAAAVVGMPVPLLAVLPPSSAALLGLQIVQFSGDSEGISSALKDLSRFFVWVLPSNPLHTLACSCITLFLVTFFRTLTKQKHHHEISTSSPRTDPNAKCIPHGLEFGAWELRALGLLAFPLGTASTQLIVDSEDLPVVGPVGSVIVLIILGHVAMSALKFVTDVIEEKDVVRTRLPRTAGGAEVYIDRECDQLRALPSRPPQPGCSILFGSWLATPAWCVAPTVATIETTDQLGATTARDQELDVLEQGASVGLFCSSADAAKQVQDEQLDELRTGGEVRPLLDREDTVSMDDTSNRAEDSPKTLGKARSSEMWDRPSAVARTHPMSVKMACTYDVKVNNLVAGVVCIPWLDCAVPAGALRRLEEVCGDITLQVHPAQLSGSLASGRYAACFDWGTHWPWRWPLETAVKIFVGVWVALPMSLDAFQGPITLLVHIVVLCFVSTFAYGAYAVQPYGYVYDNASFVASWCTVALTLFVRSFGNAMPSVAGLATILAAGTILTTCCVTLLASVAIASVMLGRLEVQGLQDRLLACNIDGWGPGSFTSCGDLTPLVDDFPNPQGCGMAPDNFGHGSNAVEVILPGPRPSLAIVLPAMASPTVAHVQLLPPVAGRSSEPESLTPSATAGDRARLPLPPSILFPTRGQRQHYYTPPLAALLAPGRPGRLIYLDSSHNEGGVEWQAAVHDFFGSQGTQLADETQRFIESNLSQEDTGTESPLNVVEVLPAFAAEFMDERLEPGSRT